jgi:hexokinase
MTIEEEILLQIENAFQVTDKQLNDLVIGIQEEMKAGLNIDKSLNSYESSELKMIPSYVTGTC